MHRLILALSGVIAVLAAGAATAGLWSEELYRNDSVLVAAGLRAQDLVTLFIAVPLLVVVTAAWHSGSARAGLAVVGTLGYFLYVYASMALGAAYNSLFLLYLTILSISFFSVVCTLGSFELRFTSPPPRRAAAMFMFISGGMTLIVWLVPLITAAVHARPPGLLDGYTTLVTCALDLAIIAPSAWVAGTLILKGRALGYVIAASLSGVIVMLGPVIALGTYYQMAAGVEFSTGEIVGPIAGFLALGFAGLAVMVAILRAAGGRPIATHRGGPSWLPVQ